MTCITMQRPAIRYSTDLERIFLYGCILLMLWPLVKALEGTGESLFLRRIA